MDLAVPELAQELGASFRKLVRAEGGVELCRQAEADAVRRVSVGDRLTGLGIWELDPRADVEQAMAAAEITRVAGAVVLPYPVVGRLLAIGDSWLAVARDGGSPARVEHGDLSNHWVLAALDGTATSPSQLRRHPGLMLAPFLSRGEAGPGTDPVPDRDVAFWLNFDSFWLLGAAETALARTVEHTSVRQQFGRPLSSFQGIRLRVADCVTLLQGLLMLGRYTVWHAFDTPSDALVDALALLAVALEAVQATFAAAHQFHGAIGFSVEHDVTLLHRHVQGHLRLPVDQDELGRLLARQIDRSGFESLYGRFQGPGTAGMGR